MNYRYIPKTELIPGMILLYGVVPDLKLDGIVLRVDLDQKKFWYYQYNNGVYEIFMWAEPSIILC